MVSNWTQNAAKIKQVLNPNPPEINTKSNEASIKLSTQTQPGKTIFLLVGERSAKSTVKHCAKNLSNYTAQTIFEKFGVQ